MVAQAYSEKRTLAQKINLQQHTALKKCEQQVASTTISPFLFFTYICAACRK
jgi:hypothetical protein